MTISIICPIRNDFSHFDKLISTLQQTIILEDFELVVINDCSTDFDRNIYLEKLRKSKLNFKYVFNSKRLGITGSIFVGAQQSSHAVVLILEGDNDVSPRNLNSLLQKKIETDADLIQGVGISTLLRSSEKKAEFIDKLIRAQFGNELKSPTSLLMLLRRDLLLEILDNYKNYNFKHLFISSLALSKGYTVEEVVSSKHLNKNKVRNFRNIATYLRIIIDLSRLKSNKKENRPVIANSLPLLEYQFEMKILRRIRFWFYFKTFPLHKWMITNDSIKYYKTLKALEFTDKDQIRDISEIRLRRILLHCFNHVPYYKKLWKELGFEHKDFYNSDILQKLPLLTKANVTENRESNLFSEKTIKSEILEIRTSGSSGQPFTTYADRFQLEVRFASTMRALEMTGYKFGDRQLRLWHQKIGMTKFQARAERIDAFFLRRKFVPAFEISNEKLIELNKTIQNVNPVLIDGYAESMNYLAGSKQIEGSISALKGIMTSAQELTKPSRDTIEGKFLVPVFDKYGSREFSGIAYECREGRVRHVQDESYILEILIGGRLAKPGEVGEVVITDLNNYSFPLIRYRIGDLALCLEQRECTCGRPLSQIGPIQGRAQALVSCANGVWLPGTFFAHFFKEYEETIQYFQVVQTETEKFSVKYVKAETFAELDLEEIKEKLAEFTGPETQVNFEAVKEIPLLATGKRTPVVSHLKPDFQMISKE